MVLAEVKVDNIYIVCGYTDMRKSITGLSTIIVQQFEMRPDEHSMFLFCGKRADRMKALIWEGDGFLLMYKRLNIGAFNWPRSVNEAFEITQEQFTQLMQGLEIIAKRPIYELKQPPKAM